MSKIDDFRVLEEYYEKSKTEKTLTFPNMYEEKRMV